MYVDRNVEHLCKILRNELSARDCRGLLFIGAPCDASSAASRRPQIDDVKVYPEYDSESYTSARDVTYTSCLLCSISAAGCCWQSINRCKPPCTGCVGWRSQTWIAPVHHATQTHVLFALIIISIVLSPRWKAAARLACRFVVVIVLCKTNDWFMYCTDAFRL